MRMWFAARCIWSPLKILADSMRCTRSSLPAFCPRGRLCSRCWVWGSRWRSTRSRAFLLRRKTMPANAATWKIGVARRRITPPLGCQMAGFDARKGVANAVHDDLHARALVFDNGATTVALVSVEVIAVSAEFAAVVRALVVSATGIPAANVFLCATHTHCGPVTMHHFFNQGQPLDEDYLAALRDAIVAAVHAAADDRKPRALKAGMVRCEGIAVNRR